MCLIFNAENIKIWNSNEESMFVRFVRLKNYEKANRDAFVASNDKYHDEQPTDFIHHKIFVCHLNFARI